MKAIADFKKYLEDTKSPIIQQLVNDFGTEVVFSKERKFSIDDEMLRKIFDSLNKSLFNSELPIVEMHSWSVEDIKKVMIQRNVKDADKLKNNFYGVYSNTILNDDVKSTKITRRDEIVFFW